MPLRAMAAPSAAFVIDARSGEVLYSQNADTRLHPASLTKMMTLYITFEAVEHGEISLDDMVTISKHAAAEPASKLWMKPGQKIKLRYLIRAAAVKSANDAATAIGEAIEGSEAAFARRMNRTAKALGMTRTTFKNANGLTREGHLSTARDMTTLGRHLFFDFPDYYNLFSRTSTDAGIKTVYSSNRRFLNSYRGADGIKTGYTNASGFNLVASAQRGDKRIIATVFGGRSSAARNARVAELLDLGFRKAPTRVAVRRPERPAYAGHVGDDDRSGKTIRLVTTIKKSLRPKMRPAPETPAPSEEMLAAIQDEVQNAVAQANAATPENGLTAAPEPKLAPEEITVATADGNGMDDGALGETIMPRPRPAELTLASLSEEPDGRQQVVSRASSSGGRYWGINVGTYGTEFQAEGILLKTALKEIGTLDSALRKVSRGSRGFDANFVGMTQEEAALACRRLQARGSDCTPFGPSS
ncbi:MAG: D-alanyl-D-alanine carboxypeptidase family protein [Paracoccaceae bacterium]